MAAEIKRPATPAGPPGPGGADGLQASLEQSILRGLLSEWENARSLLPGPLRRSIRRPLFSIRRMQARLGCWDRDKREISLARDLVMAHRWDDIKEVLLHEMAHQVAHEGLHAGSQTAHGDCFRKACGLLRANPAASGTYATLHARLHANGALSDRDRIVVRIRKLMALAQSSNPNEAHAAMCKAYELISRHNVEMIGSGIDQDYLSIFLGEPRLRHFRETYYLAHLLQDLYFVQGIWISAWVLAKGKMGRVLEISGTADNIRIAEYVHEAIRRFIDKSWQDYRQGKTLNRACQTDFAVGVIDGFKTTLQQASARDEPSHASRLPIRLEDRALAGYLSRRYPHVRSFSRTGPAHDPRVLADGAEKGKKLIIAKGITHGEGFEHKMLEYTRPS